MVFFDFATQVYQIFPCFPSRVTRKDWWIVVYPESLPENWKEIISTEPVAISPLHDKDVNADGTKKKPHYHIVFNYKGNKSFEQMDEMARVLRAPIPERISGLTGAVRYLTHMDIRA